MQIVSKLLLAATTAAAITAMMAIPALADPPPGVTPMPADVVGVGSDTMQNVFDQFSHDYNAAHSTGKLYSFDATNPATGIPGGGIQTKSGSCSSIARPYGSVAGRSALVGTGTTTGGRPCIDFARSTVLLPSPTISFIPLAKDAVTYATQPGSHAPANLTTADLTGIYNCTIIRWNQIPGNSGGSSATISAFIPQDGSDTRAAFLAALGLTNPGTCVSSSAKPGDSGNTLLGDEGVAPTLNSNKANVIVPFSVANWIAERFHSASCGTIAQCFASPAHCTPAAGLNLFGCNTHGTMVLNKINGTAPTSGSGRATVINSGFTAAFIHLLYEAVNTPTPGIPAYLQPYFGSAGWACATVKAKTDLKNYGFLVLPPSGPTTCGSLG